MIEFKIIEMIKDIRDWYSGLSNVAKFNLNIFLGLVPALALVTVFLGKDGTIQLLGNFSDKLKSSDPYHLILFFTNCLLAVVFVIAGIAETHLINKRYSEYTPPPPPGAGLLNFMVVMSMIFLIYNSIYNTFYYVAIYILFLPIDFYFRHAIADNAKKNVIIALGDKTLIRSNLEEFYIYHSRYPKFAVFCTRLLLVFTSSVFLILYSNTKTAYFEYFACMTMIYCIIINEIFSWGYRLRLIIIDNMRADIEGK